MKKLFFTLVMLLALNQLSNAQGQTCLPTDSDYCNQPCAVVCDIENETDLTLYFAWGYQGGPCSQDIVNGSGGIVGPLDPVTQTNAYTPPLPWVGPCMRFCDQPCECPTLFRLLDPVGGGAIEPWDGVGFYMLNQNMIFTYNTGLTGTLTLPSGLIRSGNVMVDVSVINGCFKLRFYIQ